MEDGKYIVYIRVDESGSIVEINSDAFLDNIDGYIELDSGYGDKYHHAQGNYLDEPIFDFNGYYNYKFINGEVIKRSEIEKEKDKLELKATPSQIDIIEAQITYTAMMTNTLLGE